MHLISNNCASITVRKLAAVLQDKVSQISNIQLIWKRIMSDGHKEISELIIQLRQTQKQWSRHSLNQKPIFKPALKNMLMLNLYESFLF